MTTRTSSLGLDVTKHRASAVILVGAGAEQATVEVEIAWKFPDGRTDERQLKQAVGTEIAKVLSEAAKARF